MPRVSMNVLLQLARRISQASASMPLLSRVLIGSAALSVVVAGMFVVLLVAMSGLRSSTDAQARSQEVSAATLQGGRGVHERAPSLRGFVLSGNGPFLASWQQARAALPPAIAELERRVASQPEEKSQ